MAYIDRADIESVFGAKSVSQWADLDGEKSLDTIDARITEAIAAAEELADDMLRGGPFVVPITATLPRTLKRAIAKIAGVDLYEARGVADYNPETGVAVHRLMWQKKAALDVFKMVKSGEIQLILTRTSSAVPCVRAPEVATP